jgi:hypothetical protein
MMFHQTPCAALSGVCFPGLFSTLLIPRPAGFLDLRLFFHGLFKATDGLTQALPKLWEALCSEDKKRNREDDNKLLHTETEHKIVSF